MILLNKSDNEGGPKFRKIDDVFYEWPYMLYKPVKFAYSNCTLQTKLVNEFILSLSQNFIARIVSRETIFCVACTFFPLHNNLVTCSSIKWIIIRCSSWYGWWYRWRHSFQWWLWFSSFNKTPSKTPFRPPLRHPFRYGTPFKSPF